MNSSFGHGGDINRYSQESGLRPSEILDFSASINPLGPPHWFKNVIEETLPELSRYPDPFCSVFIRAAGEALEVPESQVVPGNGATELLRAIPMAIAAKRGVVPVPAYTDYERALSLARLHVEMVPCDMGNGFSLNVDVLRKVIKPGDMVYIGRPNNPTGHAPDGDIIREVAMECPEAVFVVDESFGGFVDGFDTLINRRPDNVIVVVSLTKLFAVPGLRIGYLVAGEAMAKKIRDYVPPWSVNSLAQAVGAKAMKDFDYMERSRKFVRENREKLAGALSRIRSLYIYPAAANFLLGRVEKEGVNATGLYAKLLRRGIAIRVCGDFKRLDDRHFRVAVRDEAENRRLVADLGEALR